MDELDRRAAHNLGTEQLRGAIDFARDVLRSATLINGGAAVALLAFAGSVWSSPETNSTLDTALILWALSVFIFGVFFFRSCNRVRVFYSIHLFPGEY